MSLKLTTITAFAAVAHVSLPTENPGVFNEGSIICRFNYLTDADVSAFLDGVSDLSAGGQPRISELLEHQHAFLKRALVGVEGITDDNGNLASEVQLSMVINSQALWVPALNAFLETRGGAKSKNSKPSQKR